MISPSTGKVTGTILAGWGPHETIVGLDGKDVYLGGVDTPYLEVANTSTGSVVRKVGPLHGPGVRPFTINASQTVAFTTSWGFLGFQVSSVETEKVLYSVSPPGFRFDPAFGIPDHGISLSPDGRELYLIDTPNGYVHVFDVSGLPRLHPRDIADIKLAHPPRSSASWLQHISQILQVPYRSSSKAYRSSAVRPMKWVAPHRQITYPNFSPPRTDYRLRNPSCR